MSGTGFGAGSAYLDGNTGYIKLPTIPSAASGGPNMYSAYSLEMWVCLQSSTGWQRLFDLSNQVLTIVGDCSSRPDNIIFTVYGGYSGSGYEIALEYCGSSGCGSVGNPSTTNPSSMVAISSPLATNVWYYVVLTMSVNSGLFTSTIYVNGIPGGSLTGSTSRIQDYYFYDTTRVQNYIGKSSCSVNPNLNAYVAEAVRSNISGPPGGVYCNVFAPYALKLGRLGQRGGRDGRNAVLAFERLHFFFRCIETIAGHLRLLLIRRTSPSTLQRKELRPATCAANPTTCAATSASTACAATSASTACASAAPTTSASVPAAPCASKPTASKPASVQFRGVRGDSQRGSVQPDIKMALSLQHVA